MSARTISLAVLGCGRIAELVHLDAIARLGGARVIAIAEANAARRERALARAPGATAVGDWREAIEQPDVNAVIVALPNELHAPAALAALAAGRHLYLEKPLATDPADGRRVLAAHANSGRVAAIGFNYRFHPLHARARQLVAAGEIGTVRSAHFAFGMPEDQMPDWKRRPGGSVVHDLGSHVVDLARHLLGQEIETVAAGGDSERAWLVLRLDGGAHITASLDRAAAAHDVLEVRGTRGSLRIDRLRGVEVRVDGRRPTLAPIARLRRWRNPSYEPSYTGALRAFVEAVRGRPHPAAANLTDGLRALEVIAAADGSLVNGSRTQALARS